MILEGALSFAFFFQLGMYAFFIEMSARFLFSLIASGVSFIIFYVAMAFSGFLAGYGDAYGLVFLDSVLAALIVSSLPALGRWRLEHQARKAIGTDEEASHAIERPPVIIDTKRVMTALIWPILGMGTLFFLVIPFIE